MQAKVSNGVAIFVREVLTAFYIINAQKRRTHET